MELFRDLTASPLLLVKVSDHWPRNDRMRQQPLRRRHLATGRGATQGFQQSHPQRYQGRGGGNQGGRLERDGPQLATKPPRAKRNDYRYQQHSAANSDCFSLCKQFIKNQL